MKENQINAGGINGLGKGTINVNSDDFKRLQEMIKERSSSQEKREAYKESLKYYRDLKNVVDTSKEEGIVEGMVAGRAEGRIERNIEIAKALKKNGIAIEVIIQSTGLPKEEIEKL